MFVAILIILYDIYKHMYIYVYTNRNMILWYDIYTALLAYPSQFRSFIHTSSLVACVWALHSLLLWLLLLLVILLANLVGWWYSFIGVLHTYMHIFVWILVAPSPHPFICMYVCCRWNLPLYVCVCMSYISSRRIYAHMRR